MLGGAVVGALDERADIAVELSRKENARLLQQEVVVGVGPRRGRRILIVLRVGEASDHHRRDRRRLFESHAAAHGIAAELEAASEWGQLREGRMACRAWLARLARVTRQGRGGWRLDQDPGGDDRCGEACGAAEPADHPKIRPPVCDFRHPCAAWAPLSVVMSGILRPPTGGIAIKIVSQRLSDRILPMTIPRQKYLSSGGDILFSRVARKQHKRLCAKTLS